MTEKNCFDVGTELHYSVHGDGHPVVLIHGFAASNYDWVYLTPELINYGYQAIAPDLIGHGNSNKPRDPGCYTYSFLYQHFVDWIATLEKDQEITLVGHSMGGLIALNYAIQNPEAVHRLVLIDPYYDQNQLNSILRYINQKPGWYQKALQITPQWLIHTLISLDVKGLIHYEDRTRKQIAEDYKRASPDIVYIPGSIPDLSEGITHVKSPTLVIWGTSDATLNPKSFPTMVQSFPNGQGKAIQGAGHQPHLTRPKEFNQSVTDFLGFNPGQN
ncbi:MAG: alpha/beta hydrolase [Chloroflexi bacterium]|nr:alpha/beta hydrolase [Chloroflexota bacterium]